ncbi:hypothetical protein [Afipia clevelandensis]|uniref:Uncharacterized protein n=1 Tax=Afipia clevelandensis ATCC 49720 TaxID=883079 RepID=K8NZ35_9BRAD|nr:hypothetical protein [Afipia clevelandensis]EKS32670.1 hypothetical protein HMPREF9696_03647 [Afipia clevelandensis ATCC 49720]
MPDSNPTSLSILKLDKLSVTRPESDSVEVQSNVRSFQDHCTKLGIPYASTSRYAVQAAVPIRTGSGIEKCTIQLGAWEKGTNAYRIECNPAKLGPVGREELDTLLLSIAGVDFREFVATGKVTRADVAVDLPDILADDVIVRSSHMRKHGIYSSQLGVPETVYIGKDNIAVYDKGTQANDGITRLRVERRLKPNCLGHDLPNIANPFEKIRVTPTSVLKPMLPDMADALLDSMRVRGIKRVIANFARQDRLRIERVVDDEANNLLPASLWDSWPSCLADAGIANPVTEHAAQDTLP